MKVNAADEKGINIIEAILRFSVIGKPVNIFAPVENADKKFWRKFGGIAPIPPAPMEGQRSNVT